MQNYPLKLTHHCAKQGRNTGPLINFLTAKGASRCRVPITVVPINLPDEQPDALS